MFTIIVTRINLEIVKKFTMDRRVLLNLAVLIEKFQFDSFVFMRKVERVIRI